MRALLGALALASALVPALGKPWLDVDCSTKWNNWAPLRNVLGEDLAEDSDSLGWASQAGFGAFVGTSPTAETWDEVAPRLREVLPLVPLAAASGCLAVRVMAEVLSALLEHWGQVHWGPVELLAASRFPIFRALCAASTPYDGLAAHFLRSIRSAPQDVVWAQELSAKAAKVSQSSGSQGAAWVAHFVLGLMGLRSGTEHALEQVQLTLEQNSLSQLLPSSFFCMLHGLKLWRLRAPAPRRQAPQLPPEALQEPPSGQPLHMTAAWGQASRSVRRWVRRAGELHLKALVYCLDAPALQACTDAVREVGSGWCLGGPAHGDAHGSDKYEVLLAAAAGGRSALWTDIDSHFLADPGGSLEHVSEVGLVRHPRATCLNGGLLLLRPAGAPVIEQLVHWLHHFPFGFEQNGLNTLARGSSDAPFLEGSFASPTFLDERLFTAGVDGVVGEPLWLHLWTPPSYDLQDFLEALAESGRVADALPMLQREPPDRDDLLDCSIVQVALRAPVLIRFAMEPVQGFWQREDVQETQWQRRIYTWAGEAYEEGTLVKQDIARARAMYERAAARGSSEASQAVVRLDYKRTILNLL